MEPPRDPPQDPPLDPPPDPPWAPPRDPDGWGVDPRCGMPVCGTGWAMRIPPTCRGRFSRRGRGQVRRRVRRRPPCVEPEMSASREPRVDRTLLDPDRVLDPRTRPPLRTVFPDWVGSDTNFAPLILPNGSLLAIWRSWEATGSRCFLATAADWRNASSYKQARGASACCLGNALGNAPAACCSLAPTHSLLPGQRSWQRSRGLLYSAPFSVPAMLALTLSSRHAHAPASSIPRSTITR